MALIICALPAKAQTEQRGIYQNHMHFGLMAHTKGYGFNVRKYKNITYDKRQILEFDFSLTMKHKREQLAVGNSIGQSLYFFGKLNHIFIPRFFYGRQYIIADFEHPLGVRLSFNWLAGVNTTMAKPIYLRIYTSATKPAEIQRFDPVLHQDPRIIEGSGPWYKGLNEMKFYPGVSAKAALSFEWGKQEDAYKFLELGVMADVYTTKVPIMAYSEENTPYFINVYATFSPKGQRW
ncbi:MAG: hypothetical protein KDC92_06975 [Bacteroidetes bacterium]|nr:hypothetical protein [Bacteroidota bacterium]